MGQKFYKRILVALDGSEDSLAGARLVLELAEGLGSEVRAAHVYDTAIHNSRFREIEPGLPRQYQAPASMGRLRKEHNSLMSEGFMALSLGYMEDFLSRARQCGVIATEKAAAGRNYLGILEMLREEEFGLAVLGATGLGAQQDGMLGSTAVRVLRRAPGDILIARAARRETPGKVIMACVDGSLPAAAAMRKAVKLACAMHGELHLFSAYDTAFHRTIFKTMARSLSVERQREIGLDRQETVHEELIDKSLQSLYGSYVDKAAREAVLAMPDVQSCLRPGKAYRAIVDYAAEIEADLIVLGRYGHNYEEVSDIGSHAEAVARLAPCSVLVCGNGPGGPEPA
ncbi:MAG: universal stress protein [Thermodesulfobacteriota bacterium]